MKNFINIFWVSDLLISFAIFLVSILFILLDCKMQQKRLAFSNLNGYGKSKILALFIVALIFFIKGLLKLIGIV